MRDRKLSQLGLELTQLLTTMHIVWRFDATSRVEIDCTKSSFCQAHYSSGGRASGIKYDGRRIVSQVRLTLYLESKNPGTALNTT